MAASELFKHRKRGYCLQGVVQIFGFFFPSVFWVRKPRFGAARAALAGRLCRVTANSAELLNSKNSEPPGQDTPSLQPVPTFPPGAPSTPLAAAAVPSRQSLAGKAGQERAGLLQAAPPSTPGARGAPSSPSAACQPKADHKETSVRLQGSGTWRGAQSLPAAVCLQTTQLSCEEGLKAVIVFN